MNRKTMLHYQGDKVLVVIGQEQTIYTIIRFVDGDSQELQLVNKSEKNPEPLPITQAVLDNLVPIKNSEAKWKLVLT